MTIPLPVRVHKFATHSLHIQPDVTLNFQFRAFVYAFVIRDLQSLVIKVFFFLCSMSYSVIHSEINYDCYKFNYGNTPI
jgi:hypothetical protein